MNNQIIKHESTLGIHNIMEALKEMPLPDDYVGWNQVVLINIEDREGQRLCFEWIFNNDQWHVVEGQPQKPTLIIEESERDFIGRITGQYVDNPRFTMGSIKNSVKFVTFIGKVVGYLQSKFSNNVAEIKEVVAEIKEVEKSKVAKNFKSPWQSAYRILQWLVYAIFAIVAYKFGYEWISGEKNESWIPVSGIVLVSILMIKIVIEIVLYRRYHQTGSKK